jgi:hypothetical protein
MKRTKGTNETSHDDNDMIKIALEIFRTDAFLAINKKLIQKVGIIKAAYIANLVDKYKYFRDRGMLTEDGGFFLTYEEQTKQLGLSEHQLRTCKKEFIEAGILSTKMRGVPRKEFYFIDFGELLSQFIVDEEDEPIEPIPDDSTNAKNTDESGDQFKQYSLKNLRNNAQKIQGIMLENFKQYSSKNSSNIKENLYKENKERNIKLFDCNTNDEEEKMKDKNSRYVPLAEKLAFIIRKNKRINVTPQRISSWANEIRKLVETDGVSIQRVETALDWYEENIGGQYVPVIESGFSLRSKFIKLEDAMRRAGAVPGQSKTISTDTPKDPKKVLQQFFRSKDLTYVFYRDCYEPAEALFEGTVDGGTLAETLLHLYSQIKEKQEQHLKGDLVRLLPGPMELIARYIDWIRDNSWITDIRLDMFDLNHSLFRRFRRDEAKTDNLERDAITGKSYLRG